MARENIADIEERTTIILPKYLNDRVRKHVLSQGETITDFMKRAVVNQLENENDYEIRDIVEAFDDGK